jgi:hypothetical protein
MHPGYFARERARVWAYGLALPVLALGGLFWWPLLVAVLAAYSMSYAKTAQGLRAGGMGTRAALHQAIFLSLSKFPNLIGMLTYKLRKWQGVAMQIIEYK